MRVAVYGLDGVVSGGVDLPRVFETDTRPDVIHKVYVNLDSHRFQPQGRHPTAGMDVVARSGDPPTGRGTSRIAKMLGGGGGRQGQAGGVASVRGGRQAHPPRSNKVIWKRVNKKENRLALCSAIAYTTHMDAILKRGHKIGSLNKFPIILDSSIESVDTTKGLVDILRRLDLLGDMERLKSRKGRTGKSALRGRGKKVGKSILFVVSGDVPLKKASGSLPGIDVVPARDLSVLDLAPGANPARLTIYSQGALEEISKFSCKQLEIVQ
ncbi:MAG: 50S ribosomal protein L4 [Cenarchaeum sp. SB0662_bin_33]|nr:50S ribosomal protein L4 [Cenarchaeum sp. SB0662_bin_33]